MVEIAVGNFQRPPPTGGRVGTAAPTANIHLMHQHLQGCVVVHLLSDLTSQVLLGRAGADCYYDTRGSTKDQAKDEVVVSGGYVDRDPAVEPRTDFPGVNFVWP